MSALKIKTLTGVWMIKATDRWKSDDQSWLEARPSSLAPLFFTSLLSTCNQCLLQCCLVTHFTLALLSLAETLVSPALEMSGLCTGTCV